MKEDLDKIKALNRAHRVRLSRAFPGQMTLGVGSPKEKGGKPRVSLQTQKLGPDQLAVVEEFRRIVEAEGFELDYGELLEPIKKLRTDT